MKIGNDIVIRAYEPADELACCSLFDSNVPKYFHPTEREGYVAFLKGRARDRYWVLEHSGVVVGCGGIGVDDSGRGKLHFGMVHDDQQGRGFGKALTLFRLAGLVRDPAVTFIELDTSQHTEAFYRKFGFATSRETKDGYGPGLNRIDMRLQLPADSGSRKQLLAELDGALVS